MKPSRGWISRRMRRCSRFFRPRLVYTLCFLFLLWNFLDVLLVLRSLNRPESIRNHSVKDLGLKIYISSIHWNNENILRSHWIPTVVALSKALGPENIFISVQESGSWDDSKGALRLLDSELEQLHIPRKIILDDTTHIDEIEKEPTAEGWIKTPRGRTELRRIPYLSKLRNLTLQPLRELADKGQRFDRVVFLNDVAFTMEDFVQLLNTRHGDYAAACSLDFSRPPAFYDTFALRDFEGHEPVMKDWPFFRSRVSRRAVKANTPVPVTSCWNGIVAMDAEPFYDRARPLGFRGVSDSLAEHHVEGSECCLIHADNSLSSRKGVWMNPGVRVGYSPEAYESVHPGASTQWISSMEIALGLWENRMKRWFTTPMFKEWIVSRRVDSWKHSGSGRIENGKNCLINEMQVLISNGWAHV